MGKIDADSFFGRDGLALRAVFLSAESREFEGKVKTSVTLFDGSRTHRVSWPLPDLPRPYSRVLVELEQGVYSGSLWMRALEWRELDSGMLGA